MAYWALIIFILGLVALIFRILEIFDWFINVWPIILMLCAFAMLSHIAAKQRKGEKEALRRSIEELEAKLREYENKQP
ncbi:MAG: hypothetical protein ABIL05_00515 [candidate division WOR-3 bacterium]